MELDKITRVYMIKRPPFQPIEAQVLNSADPAKKAIAYSGSEAQAIFDRADFRLIPYTTITGRSRSDRYHVYHAPFTKDVAIFDINTTKWRVGRDTAECYRQVAHMLDRQSTQRVLPQQGLTIVVLKY